MTCDHLKPYKFNSWPLFKGCIFLRAVSKYWFFPPQIVWFELQLWNSKTIQYLKKAKAKTNVLKICRISRSRKIPSELVDNLNYLKDILKTTGNLSTHQVKYVRPIWNYQTMNRDKTYQFQIQVYFKASVDRRQSSCSNDWYNKWKSPCRYAVCSRCSVLWCSVLCCET